MRPQPTILVVEDDQNVRHTLEDSLCKAGYRTLTAPSAEDALELLGTHAVDLIITDVHMSGMSGIELCAKVKGDARWQFIPVIVLTAFSDLDERLAGLEAGADDFFAKPIEPLELRTRTAALLRVKDLLDQLERAESVITTLGLTIEARDPYTAGHCERLARYAVAFGREVGVDATTLKALKLGGFLHDLGKIAVPDRILLKPGKLDRRERSIIQSHPVVGVGLIQGMRTLEAVWPIVRHHHERFDGSGYPDGLQGNEIPLGARIMAIVDVYDALRTARPYKPAYTREQAIDTMRREAEAGAWEPELLVKFLDLIRAAGVR